MRILTFAASALLALFTCLAALPTASGAQAVSFAGTYAKHTDGLASLRVKALDGNRWEIHVEAGGIPNGGATAADCNFTAIGRISGNRFQGEITLANMVDGLNEGDPVEAGRAVTIAFKDGMAVIDSARVDMCALGNGVLGAYAKSAGASGPISVRTERYARPPYSDATYYIYENSGEIICTKAEVCNKYGECQVTYKKGAYKDSADKQTGAPYETTSPVLIAAEKLSKHTCLNKFSLNRP